MPIYTFKCKEPDCDTEVTVLAKINDNSVPTHYCKSQDKYSLLLPLARVLDVPSPMQWGCKRF